jgi:hypothetical protein
MWNDEKAIGTIQCKEAEHHFEKVEIDLLIHCGGYQTDAGWDAWGIAFMNKLSATIMGVAKGPVANAVHTDVDDAVVCI